MMDGRSAMFLWTVVVDCCFESCIKLLSEISVGLQVNFKMWSKKWLDSSSDSVLLLIPSCYSHLSKKNMNLWKRKEEKWWIQQEFHCIVSASTKRNSNKQIKHKLISKHRVLQIKIGIIVNLHTALLDDQLLRNLQQWTERNIKNTSRMGFTWPKMPTAREKSASKRVHQGIQDSLASRILSRNSLKISFVDVSVAFFPANAAFFAFCSSSR